MKYLIIGVGGTGGAIGGYLLSENKDVSFIAHGKNKEAMEKDGLTVHTYKRGTVHVDHPKVFTMEEWEGKADVIFVCVKWYSIDEVVEFLKKAADKDTLVIPILNIIGAGEKMQEKLSNCEVLDGVIYICAYLEKPGTIRDLGVAADIVTGYREKGHNLEKLTACSNEMKKCGVNLLISEDIRSAAFEKLSIVSPFASVGTYYECTAKGLQRDPEKLQLFKECVEEIHQIALAMGLSMREDIVKKNTDILMSNDPESSASMQKDYLAGRKSEVDGLVYEIVRLGKKWNVPTPAYSKIAKKLGYQE